MAKFTCPACGGEFQLKSKFSVFGICTYCKSTIVRHDVNLETMGKMADLPQDMSPLQIGTRGQIERATFEIVGRLKMAWEDGAWNEWYVLFDNGKDGWLAEAQGFYMISYALSTFDKLPPVDKVSVNLKISINKDSTFVVDDIKQATCVGSEGELPFPAPIGRRSTSIDLSGPGDQFACIEYADDGVRIYVGHYAEFNQLALSSLRQIDGW